MQKRTARIARAAGKRGRSAFRLDAGAPAPPRAAADGQGGAPVGIEAALMRICVALGSNLRLATVLDTILEISMNEMRAQEGSILLFDEGRNALEMLASRGLPPEIEARGFLPRKGSIAQWVLDHDQPLAIDGEPKGKDFQAEARRRRIASSLCLPLRVNGKAFGTLNLNRLDTFGRPFDKGDLAFMIIIATHAAIRIDNARLHELSVVRERLSAIGETVIGVAHCVKNLLTALKGGVTACHYAAERQDWESFVKGSEVLNRGVNRVSTLVLDMLEYSKGDAPAMERFSVDKLFCELRDLKEGDASTRGIAMSFQVHPGGEEAWGSANQVFRCLLNLVQNALDATPRGGRAALSSESSADPRVLRKLPVSAPRALVLQVEDSGAGISPEIASKIFDPFFTTKGSKGTGLGLAVTCKIMREHRGAIELASPPGSPARFALYLPLEEPARALLA